MRETCAEAGSDAAVCAGTLAYSPPALGQSPRPRLGGQLGPFGIERELFGRELGLLRVTPERERARRR